MANRIFGLLLLAALGATGALAQEHWVATWAAAQQQPGNPAPPPGPQLAAPANGGGRGAAAPTSFHNQTIRMIVRISALGGQKLRLQLSNAYGTAPLAVGAVHVARRAKDSEIAAGTDRPVTFSGKTAFFIPAGAVMVSDAVEFSVAALAELAVSVYVPGDSGPLTRHGLSLRPTYVSKDGDFTFSGAIPDATIMQGWAWLSEIDVLASAKASALVTFGDSITDGARSTPETDHSWPNILARRLVANKRTANVGLANEGIAGNRVLVDGVGTNALGRFDRDAITVAGVKWLTVLEGINDIGRGAKADDVIAGLQQMIERAHTHGIRVIGCTITPFEGANYYTEQGEQARERSISGSATARHSMPWWISTPRRATPRTPRKSVPNSTAAIICIRMMRVTRLWPTPLISGCSVSQRSHSS